MPGAHLDFIQRQILASDWNAIVNAGCRITLRQFAAKHGLRCETWRTKSSWKGCKTTAVTPRTEGLERVCRLRGARRFGIICGQMNENMKTTLKAWPVIAAATIGLCFATKTVAGLFGVELPDQNQIVQVLNVLRHAFDNAKMFAAAAFVVQQVVVLAPAFEEPIFRWLLWGLPTKRGLRGGRTAAWVVAAVSSVAFSAVHYIDFQALARGEGFHLMPISDAFLALVFFGLAQCWLYLRTQRLWCPILNHCLFNLTNLVLVLVVPD